MKSLAWNISWDCVSVVSFFACNGFWNSRHYSTHQDMETFSLGCDGFEKLPASHPSQEHCDADYETYLFTVH